MHISQTLMKILCTVVNTQTNSVVGSIQVGLYPFGVAVSPIGNRVYITSTLCVTGCNGIVSIIDTTNNTVIATASVPDAPTGLAVTPDGSAIYVADVEFTGTAGVVSVINTATNTVIATVPVGVNPWGVVVTPDGTKAYITNGGETSVSVINTQSNTVSATIQVGSQPTGIAMSPDGSVVYTVLGFSSNILIIDTATDAIVGTISYDSPSLYHAGIAIKPDGGRLYVSSPGNPDGDSVSVINPTTRETVAVIPFAANSHPYGLAVTPDGSKVFVANSGSNNVSVIATANNTVIETIPVGSAPYAFGVFIQPRFAGTPGKPNCYGKSVSALAQQYGGLTNAAAALGYPSVSALQNAIEAYCEA